MTEGPTSSLAHDGNIGAGGESDHEVADDLLPHPILPLEVKGSGPGMEQDMAAEHPSSSLTHRGCGGNIAAGRDNDPRVADDLPPPPISPLKVEVPYARGPHFARQLGQGGSTTLASVTVAKTLAASQCPDLIQASGGRDYSLAPLPITPARLVVSSSLLLLVPYARGPHLALQLGGRPMCEAHTLHRSTQFKDLHMRRCVVNE
eukprot:gene27274-4578_t